MTDNVHVTGYRILRNVGEGGMATVYLALQESLDREVALKVMSPVLAANAAFCEQFMKEGRITAKLTHPHLMTVHDIGAENGVYYLAASLNQLRMAYYQRTDLRINKSWTRDKWKFALYGEILNVSNRTNYLFDSLNSYNTKTGQTSISLDTMLPILPSLGILFER